MSARAAHRWPWPAVIAHRCGGLLAPENSIEGLVRAQAIGCRGAEFDAMLAACGTPVLMHDETLERTTTGRGRVAQTSWAALSQVALKTRDGSVSAEGVPSLAMALDACLRLGMTPNIEIKPSAGADHATGRVVAEVAAALWQRSGVTPPLLSSFSPAALAAAALAAPALPRALLLERVQDDSLVVAHALGCVAVVVEQTQLGPQLIAQAHAAGLGIAIYTENDAERGQQSLASGLDGLITDRPERFLR
ncbi:glycerophosphodiester phosphodiesterase family protein [Denitromonas ohlonensis]|uniref:Glycerophosphodiester phosphodiesterase n=2 Tax=Denitromonas TaxID=139331 RepID=A0A557SFB6_9RHOO|nr:glycerophosphodiester phosphodiesterase family protein [Denitromonas ohlonensis]TVO64141.1 glycerophosphodiester phosphodiesterase [Denitromonas ohlonensis]TVO76042.1 glycerophosphodiester phosphodiesterase [Denitromonas ohlonensis]